VALVALVLAVLAAGYALTARRAPSSLAEPVRLPRWDIAVRMLVATTVVVAITALAPVLGPHLAGLLSPFPVFGAVLAIFTQRTHGLAGGVEVLDGLLLGLLGPAAFFVVLALALPAVGLVAFAIATAAALTAQGLSMLGIPRSREPRLS